MTKAHGLKFVDFKLRYHRFELEDIEPDVANPPIELRADYDAVRDRLLREVELRQPVVG